MVDVDHAYEALLHIAARAAAEGLEGRQHGGDGARTPLLLLLTFSIVDFASLFYVYLALENGVSQAARYGVTGNISGALSREDSIRAAMREATPTLAIDDGDFSFSHITPGTVNWLAGSGEPADVSKVRVTHTWALMTPFIRELFANGQVTIAVESAMLNEPRFE